jgi:hypothetical protein
VLPVTEKAAAAVIVVIVIVAHEETVPVLRVARAYSPERSHS